MTLIGVKSKYGSCRGTCMGLIKFNNICIFYIKKNIYLSLVVCINKYLHTNFGSNPDIGTWKIQIHYIKIYWIQQVLR